MQLEYQLLGAKLTAAALTQMFPKVTLIAAHGTRSGFTVRATLPKGIDKSVFPLIEERVFALPAIHKMEMVCSNAKQFLRHHHQMERAKQIDFDGLIDMVQIGEFVDLCEGPIAEHLGGYRLIDLSIDGDDVTLTGAAHETAKETKNYIKNYSTMKRKDHQYKLPKLCLDHTYEQKRFELITEWRDWVKEYGGVIYDGFSKPQDAWTARLHVGMDGLADAGFLDLDAPSFGHVEGAPKEAIAAYIDKYPSIDAYGNSWELATEQQCPISFERIIALTIENEP